MNKSPAGRRDPPILLDHLLQNPDRASREGSSQIPSGFADWSCSEPNFPSPASIGGRDGSSESSYGDSIPTELDSSGFISGSVESVGIEHDRLELATSGLSVLGSASDHSSMFDPENDPEVVVPIGRSTEMLSPALGTRKWTFGRLLWWPWIFLSTCLDIASLLILIAIVAAIPLIQFASLGYLLTSAARLANREPAVRCLPGLRKAGKLGRFALVAGLLYLPVLLVVDLAYSAELLQPGSQSAFLWRIGAFAVSLLWLLHVSWAALRGGGWWHLLWPAPIRFLKQAWQLQTWRVASDRLYDFVIAMQIPKLWWLGARATVAALCWLAIPVSLMIIGQRAQDLPIAPVLGLMGAAGMTWLMFYLPFMQIEFARTDSILSFLGIGAIRRQFGMAPFAHALAILVLCALAIPLYVLKIEATPADLVWLPSVVFASLMLPSKLLLAWAMRCAQARTDRQLPPRGFLTRSMAKVVALSGVLVYVGALYLAQFIAGQGAVGMYFQHVFLVPNPLFVS